MSRYDEFKEFIKDKPYLKDKVKNKEVSWQELYERFDLYGKDDEIFLFKEENKQEESNEDNPSFFSLLNNIDVDKISSGLNGMKKILSILGELSSEEIKKPKMNKPYVRDDD